MLPLSRRRAGLVGRASADAKFGLRRKKEKELMKISSSVATHQLAQRRGDYGFDAPYVPIIFLCIGLAVIWLGLLAFLLWQSPPCGGSAACSLECICCSE